MAIQKCDFILKTFMCEVRIVYIHMLVVYLISLNPG